MRQWGGIEFNIQGIKSNSYNSKDIPVVLKAPLKYSFRNLMLIMAHFMIPQHKGEKKFAALMKY